MTTTLPATELANGLAVEDLTTTFGSSSNPIEAVRGVTFSIARGSTFVLLGESGSGKSVTARSILRLYGAGTRIGGTVRLDGDDLTALSEPQMRAVRGRRIGLVPQDPTGALDPLRSIGAQLVEVLRLHKITPGKLEARSRARDLLRMVGIPDPARVAASRPHQLSGGMRQRAVIAIAIACEPHVLIADEPTTALDVTVQAAVLEVFRELQRSLSMSLLLVTHDVGVAEELGGDLGVMYAGKLVETGSVPDVLSGPRHPYTQGLLDSLPTPGVARGQLRVIPGRPPLTGEHTSGCAFAQRCSRAVASCSDEAPALVPVGERRQAACPIVNPPVHALEEMSA
jgi:oligopeptide/dipeptide ABC transporter ATP-binding protein